MDKSFYDEGSFKEVVECLYENTPPSDPNTAQGTGSIPSQESERDEDICFNDSSSDSEKTRRVGSTSS